MYKFQLIELFKLSLLQARICIPADPAVRGAHTSERPKGAQKEKNPNKGLKGGGRLHCKHFYFLRIIKMYKTSLPSAFVTTTSAVNKYVQFSQEIVIYISLQERCRNINTMINSTRVRMSSFFEFPSSCPVVLKPKQFQNYS